MSLLDSRTIRVVWLRLPSVVFAHRSPPYDHGCSPSIVVLITMSIPIRNRDVFIDDIEPSFGSHFFLMPREQAGVVIGSLAFSNSFLSFSYSLVAKVLSTMMALSKLFHNYRMVLRMSESRK